MNQGHFSNCKVSSPIFHYDQQLCSFNGFAWSDKNGIIHEITPITDNNQGWEQWLGTQP